MDCRSTVVAILERREYTGCTVNFKTYTNSIWDKKQRDNPIEKQAISPNTHERIIDDDVFEKVQEMGGCFLLAKELTSARPYRRPLRPASS